MSIRKFILLLFVLHIVLSANAKFHETYNALKDTTFFEEIKRTSSKYFSELFVYNQQEKLNKTNKSKFVIDFTIKIDDIAENPFTLLSPVQNVNPKSYFITDSKYDELNNALKSFNAEQQTDCYVLIINCFNYKLRITINGDEKIVDILNYQNKYDQIVKEKKAVPEIQSKLALMEQMANAFYAGIPKQAPFILLAEGRFSSPSTTTKIADTYFGYFFNNGIPDDKWKHIYDLLYAKFGDGELPTDGNDIADYFVKGAFNSLRQGGIKEQILTTYSKSALCNLIQTSDFLFDFNTHYSDIFASLTLQERLHCISLYCDGWVSGFGCNEEEMILGLLNTTPPDQIPDLFTNLIKPSVLKDNSNYTSTSEEVSYSLIYRINKGIDNGNYTSLMRIFKDLCERNPLYKQQSLSVYDPSVFPNRILSWKPDPQNSSVGITQMDDVDFDTDGEVTIKRSTWKEIKLVNKYTSVGTGGAGMAVVSGQEYMPIIEALPDLTLNPFDLVIFINNSNLEVINETTGINKNELQAVPAIFLKFVQKKSFNEAVTTGIIYTVDALTIVTGPGAILKAATWGRRAWVAFQVLNAGVNIGVNASGIAQDPDYAEAVKWYNILTGMFGVSDLVNGTVKSLPSVMASIGKNYQRLESALEFKNIIEYFGAVKRLGLKIKNASGNVPSQLIEQYKAFISVANNLKNKFKMKFGRDLPAEIDLTEDIINLVIKTTDELIDAARIRLNDATLEAILRTDIEKAGSELKQLLSESIDYVDEWKLLHTAGRTNLKLQEASLKALRQLRQNPRMGSLLVTDDMLANIQTFKDGTLTYGQTLDRINELVNELPNEVERFSELITTSGFSNASDYTRRHALFTVEKLLENKAFLKRASGISFEVRQEIADIPTAVADAEILVGTTRYVIEIKAGETALTNNFASQTLNYFQRVLKLENLRVSCRVLPAKLAVIDKWEKGGVLSNSVVLGLFNTYITQVLKLPEIIDDSADLKNFLNSNDKWYDLIFKTNFL